MKTTTTTTHEARAAHTNASAPTARAEGCVAGPSNATAPKRLARAYEGFLEMPVWVVLAVMWVAGAALLGSCALALYMAGSLLVSMIAGAL